MEQIIHFFQSHNLNNKVGKSTDFRLISGSPPDAVAADGASVVAL